MLFNSFPFLVFLPIAFAGYWLLGMKSVRVQNVVLVVASMVFYGWMDWRFSGLLVLSVTTAYTCGRLLENDMIPRKLTVVIALIVNLGVLGFFKYFNFFIASVNGAFGAFGLQLPLLKIALPIGISFYSFMSISYVIDCYRRMVVPVRDCLTFAAYMSFFPQLLAGPIGRGTQLLSQFGAARRFNYEQAMQGVCGIVFGLFKKMVVADTLCTYVDKLFLAPNLYSTTTCVLGAFFYSIQIYCDFSGYTDIARGVARLFSIELMENFNRPYLADRFGDFWRRWHISLSTWFRDYLYIPLGGNRVSFSRLVVNTWVVFLLSGLWHGAAWTFVAWGGLHAFYLTCGIINKRWLHLQLPKPLAVAVVFSGVSFAWMFFRAPDFTTLACYLSQLFAFHFKSSLMQICAGMGAVYFAMCWLIVGIFALCAVCPRDFAFKSGWRRGIFIAAFLMMLAFLKAPGGGDFIYFQF